MVHLVLHIFTWLACSELFAAAVPRFAIVEETKDIVYISTTHHIYKRVPDNFTLGYVGNGLTPNQLSVIPKVALSQFQQEKDIVSSSIIRHWDDATDRISAKLKLLQDEPNLLQNNFMIGGFCNPSLIFFQQRYLVAARRPDWSPVIVFAWLKKQSDNNADFSIDESSSFLGIGPGVTELRGVSGYNSNGEDPRLFVINEETMLMIRTDVSSKPFRLKIAYFQYEKSDENSHFQLINDTILQPPNYEQTHEHSQKNWSPFLTIQNELYFVYLIHDSLTIVRQNPHKLDYMEIVSDVSNDGKVSSLWQYGPVRGGSPAHRLGKTRYLSFFHSQIPTPNTGPYWHSMYMGAYLFTGNKPFQLLAMSRAPLYNDGWFEGAWMQAYQTLYVYFAVNFYFIDVKTGKIFQNIDLDSCETVRCMEQYNVTLSYGFNDKFGYVATMNLASLVDTMHFFDSGDIVNQYVDVEDIWASPNHLSKKCAVEPADFEADYNPLDFGFKFFNVSSISSPFHFQIALRPHQLIEKSHTKHHGDGQHGKSEEVMQWIADRTLIWKVIDWHFRWLTKVRMNSHGSAAESHWRCLDVGAKTGFYSLLMAQHKCKVDLFESKQSLIDSIKVSVCLNYLHDDIVIHRTAVADGKKVNLTVQSLELRHLPTVDDCIFIENKEKHFALVRIDTDGLELHALRGLKLTIDEMLVEGIILDAYPASWDRLGLTISSGSELLHDILAEKFLPYIIVGTDLCPAEVFTTNSKHDLLIDKHSELKPLSWSDLLGILDTLKIHRYVCNFLFLHNGVSLSKRLESLPFVSSQ